MRSSLHLLCSAGFVLLASGCGSREPERAVADSLPPPAPAVEPVPAVPDAPLVSVPRTRASAPAPAGRRPSAAPADTVVPAPPRDTSPWIPLDTIR